MADFKALRKDLLQKQQELANLLKEVEAARKLELLSLPGYIGLGSVDDLIRALAPHASLALQQAILRPAPVADPGPAKRRRAHITPELRRRIIEAIAARKGTAAMIATEFNVSTSAVNSIKATEKLTRKRA